MILPKKRDPRFITLRRGGLLDDDTHHALAIWAADCAQHVVRLFDDYSPDDDRPRRAIALVRAWTRGEASREAPPAARFAALSAGQAVAVAHVAAHELGAAAYAIRAAREAAPSGRGEAAARAERRWQRERLPDAIRALVLDDQKLRNAICWNVFLD
jgi:hypothetical protein